MSKQVSLAQAASAHSRRRRALDPRRLLPWTTLAPLLAVLVVFVLTALDPLGFDSVTKSQSAKILYKIYGASYPQKKNKDGVTAMRDNIAVVLLDESTIEEKFQETWPASHKVHGAVLKAILDFDPAAVLVDMLFLHVESNDKLKNRSCKADLYSSDFRNTALVVEQYKQREIPLFVVGPSKEIGVNGSEGRYEINQLATSCHEITLVSAALEGEPGQPPLYPLHNDSSQHEPAALALYHAICPRDGSRPLNDSLGRIQSAAASKCAGIPEGDPSENMEVVWGLAPAEINCARSSRYGKLACEDLGRYGSFSRAAQLLWQALTPEEYRITDPFPIPYHAEIPTSELLNGDNNEEVKRWMRGKIVIYSSGVAATKDFVLSPIHGSLSGAFIHAMALDNLLTFGDKYAQRENHGLYNSHWTKFFPTFVMLLASACVIKYRRYLLGVASPHNTVEAIREADENFLRWWIRLPLIAVILVLGSVLFFIFRIAPFNWLGLLVVIHVWHRVDKWFFGRVKHDAYEAGWV